MSGLYQGRLQGGLLFFYNKTYRCFVTDNLKDISRNIPKKFRPSLWMSVCVLLALGVLLTLGFWQVQRLGWKQDLITKIEQRMSEEPIALPQAYKDDLRYRAISVTGTFLNDKQDLLFGRSHKGSTGYLSLMPFQLTDGRLVLVNRGWVSSTRQTADLWPEGDFDGEIEIVGLLQKAPARKNNKPYSESEIKAESLFKVEPKLIAIRQDLPDLLPFYLDQIGPQNLGDYPVLLAKRVEVTNNHLQYAITWFAFALIMLVIYLMMSFRHPQKQS